MVEVVPSRGEGGASPAPTKSGRFSGADESMARFSGVGELMAVRTASILGRFGERVQTGSVAAASPARSRAWQRQPPKSMVRRSQVLHGACIQDSPRNFWKASLEGQISAMVWSFTLANCRPGMILAA